MDALHFFRGLVAIFLLGKRHNGFDGTVFLNSSLISNMGFNCDNSRINNGSSVVLSYRILTAFDIDKEVPK